MRHRVRGRDEERWSWVKTRWLRDAEGRPILACTVFRDVTRKQRAIAQAQDARARAERTAALLKRLQTLSTALSSALSVERAAEVAIDQGVAAVEAANGALWLLQGEEAVMVRSAGYSGSMVDLFARVPLGSPGPLAEAMRRGEPIWLEDYEAYRTRFAAYAAATGTVRAGVQAIACLPLKIGAHVVGAIAFAFPEERLFDAEECEFLVLLAQNCAQALERVRLFEDLRRAALRARQLQDVSAELSAALGAEDVARALVERVRETLAPRSSGVWMIAEGRTMDVVHAFGYPADTMERFRRIPLEVGLPLPDAVRAGEMIVLESMADCRARYPGLAQYVTAQGYAAFAMVIVPLRVGDARVGALAVTFDDGRRFDDEERAFLAALGRQGALALERSAALQKERTAREQAEEAGRAKDEFLAMLGHELRNPLSPIVTALHLMKLRNPDALRREREIMEGQVRQLVRLVDDLLDVARIARGKVELQRERIELGEVVKQAIETTAAAFEQKAHRLDVEVEPALALDGDRARLVQVASNLLSNAAKYTDHGGRISVRAAREGDRLVLRVRDSGTGIPGDLLPRVFDIFVQGRRTIDRSEGGLGLGLALVKNLVSLHGGRVEAHSDGAGQGSEFVVSLPAAVGAPGAIYPEPASGRPPGAPTGRPAGSAAGPFGGAPAARPGDRRRVLVVDDNVAAAALMKEALVQEGYDVHVAHDGAEALQIFSEATPDVALLDIGLPVLSGYELARQMRDGARDRPLRLVAVTGYGQEADKRRAVEAGFDRHLTKPVTPAAVLAALGDEPEPPAPSRG